MEARVWQRALGPLWRRIRLLVSRSVLNLVDDSLKLQGVQVGILGDEPAWAERFQEYGYTSHPLPGAESVVAAVGGSRSHLAALSVDDRRYRARNLAPGEVCLYTDEGDRLHFKRGRLIGVTAGSEVKVTAPVVNVIASTSVTLDTPIVTCTQDLTVQGKLSGNNAVFSADVTAEGVSSAHHKHNGDSGGETGEPI